MTATLAIALLVLAIALGDRLRRRATGPRLRGLGRAAVLLGVLALAVIVLANPFGKIVG